MLCIRAHPTWCVLDARHGERGRELVDLPGERGAGRARGRGVRVGAHVGALVDAQLHPALERPREVDRVRLERELQALLRTRFTDEHIGLYSRTEREYNTMGSPAELSVGTMRTGHDAGQRRVLGAHDELARVAGARADHEARDIHRLSYASCTYEYSYVL